MRWGALLFFDGKPLLLKRITRRVLVISGVVDWPAEQMACRAPATFEGKSLLLRRVARKIPDPSRVPV